MSSIGVRGQPTHSDVSVIEVKVDTVTMCGPNPQGMHKLPVVFRTWILFRARNEKALPIVLVDEREHFVNPPAGFRMLVEDTQELSDPDPRSFESKIAWAYAPSHNTPVKAVLRW